MLQADLRGSNKPFAGSAVLGIRAMGIFLIFGGSMASLAGIDLVWQVTALDRMWALNPSAYNELVPFGKAAGFAFILLGMILAVAAIGWFKRRLWGWRLAVAIIAVQVLGDVANVFLGRRVEGAIGAIIAGALVVYLFQDPVRSAFERHGSR
jgi:hypothetical protein